MACYNLNENAWERCFPSIPTRYDQVDVCNGFTFDQKLVFLYNYPALIDDPHSGLWFFMFTERLICVCVAVLIAIYEEYCLWCVPPNIIAFALELGMTMKVILWSRHGLATIIPVGLVWVVTMLTTSRGPRRNIDQQTARPRAAVT